MTALGNAFLGHIRNTDAIVYVLRAFEDTDTPGEVPDPLDQLCLLEIELALADLNSADRQLDKLARVAKGDASKRPDAALLARALAVLEEGKPLYRSSLDPGDRDRLREFFLLTNKPVLVVVNVGEDHIDEDASSTVAAPITDHLGDAEVIPLCVQLEAEAAQLDETERDEMLEALGLGSGALPRFLACAYRLLGLRTFLTTGEEESRAWTFRSGATAAECAGIIHSDFQRGFIRADVVRWDEVLDAGSWTAAREQGRIRSEGKAYQMTDGDVVQFKFNV